MRKYVFFFGILSALLLSCQHESDAGYSGGYQEKTAAASAEMPAPESPSTDDQVSAEIKITDLKIIRTGNISFETSDLGKTKQFLQQLSNKYKCYIASENQYKSGDRIEEEIVLRIPANAFDTLLSLIEKEARYFEQKNISSQDVTEEFMDVEVRIKNKKALETRYQELLKSTKSVKEIMEVERQINEIREQIEQAEGRLKYLSNQTSFSTLTIRFYERTSAPRGWFSKFGDAFSNGWDGFVYFLIGIVYLWPFWIAGLVAVWFARRYWKKRKSRP